MASEQVQATSMDWNSVDWSKFSPEERHRMRHRMIEEKHRGHDLMHAEMLLILFAAITLAQVLLYAWRLRHRKSYMAVTLFGMWIIPSIISIRMVFWRWLLVWSFFTVVTIFIMIKAKRTKLHVNTPRIVYRWFLFVYQASYVVGVIGYLVLLLLFTGISFLFPVNPDRVMETGVLLIFYGAYYGVMGRDCAEVCVDFMSAAMTYTTMGKSLPKVELRSDMCAVCGQRIEAPTEEGRETERTYRLTCGHLFHEFCIRGWCIVGKKQTCPYCQEKVDLGRMFRNPWEKPHLLFGHMLDVIRYCVVWIPLILTAVQITYTVLHLE